MLAQGSDSLTSAGGPLGVDAERRKVGHDAMLAARGTDREGVQDVFGDSYDAHVGVWRRVFGTADVELADPCTGARSEDLRAARRTVNGSVGEAGVPVTGEL